MTKICNTTFSYIHISKVIMYIILLKFISIFIFLNYFVLFPPLNCILLIYQQYAYRVLEWQNMPQIFQLILMEIPDQLTMHNNVFQEHNLDVS